MRVFIHSALLLFLAAACIKPSGTKGNRMSGEAAGEVPGANTEPGAQNKPQGEGEGEGTGGGSGEGEKENQESTTGAPNNIKVKSKHVLESDIAVGLGLAASELCTELNGMSCFDKIHNVALGGVSAYEDGILTAIPEPTAATAAAVERVALNACGKRAQLDSSGAPVIFVGIKKDAAGNVQDLTTLKQSITNLYERLLGRSPEAAEVTALTDFYAQVKSSAQPAEKWARYSCMAVITTTEFLFY